MIQRFTVHSDVDIGDDIVVAQSLACQNARVLASNTYIHKHQLSQMDPRDAV